MERRTRGASLQGKKRILFAFALIAVAMVLLLFRTAWIQVVKAEEYTDKAKDQQTSDIPVEAKRGAIYDRNGKELATSATCYTLWVRPAQIRENYKTDEKRQELASALAVILEFDSGDIIHAFESESVLVRLANYLEKEQATQIRDMEVYGLELSEDTKRFYPMGDFASILLGSVNDDGVGRSGIELQYNEYLSGIAGRAVMDTDISGNQLSFGQDKYYEAEDGLNVTLTIDEVLQHYLQDAIQKGYQDTGAERVFAVAMDPKTAEVLAMAVTPSFDPNEPTKPSDAAELEIFSELSLEEQSAYLSRMWRNPLISDVYEPGSTMKLITSSSSLEEGIVTPQTGFYCSGVYELYGVEMYDAEHHVHGQESLIQAVGNSCNPVHIQLALMLGAERFLSYIEKYGLTEPTGIDLPGESGSLVGNLDTIGPVELANMGFGQGLAITPLQLATAVCAIANDGVLMKPHCVSALTDKDGNAVVEYKPEVVRKVISHDTAAEMMDIMYQQVENYGGRKAQIEGYKIGGKTGTSSKVGDDGTYGDQTDTSFIAVAPIDDPQIVVLVICSSPQTTYYADLTAIPIARDFLVKALPYMGLAPADTGEGSDEDYAYVPDVTGYSYQDAAAILAEYGLKYEVTPELTSDEKKDKSFTFEVVDQYPKAGSKIDKDEKVYLYRE